MRRLLTALAGLIALAASAPAFAQPRVELFTASFLNPDSTSSLLVGVELDGVADAEDVTVRYEAVREGAPPVTVARVVRGGDGPGGPAAVPGALRVLTRIGLTPGRYTVTVTVQAGDGDPVRSARSVDVPFFATGPLAISDLLVSATKVAGTTADVEEDRHLMPLVGHPPTARRVFTRDERLEIDAEIYQAELSTATDDDVLVQGLSIVTSVLTEAGEVVYSMTESGQAETLPSGVFGYPHYTLVPIARLAPGRYVVQVTAIDDGVSVARSVPIAIVE